MCFWIVCEIASILVSCAGPIRCRLYGCAICFLGLTCNPVGTAFWLSGSIPEVCSRFHGGSCLCDRWYCSNIPAGTCGGKRLPALIRWLMTEGEARPNGCIYTYTFLAVGGKAHSTMPNVLTTWTLTKSVYGIGATGIMAVSKTVDVGSSPTCCAQPTHRLWERSSESSCGGSSFSRPA